MSTSTICPACDSDLYGVVKVYAGDDGTGSLTLQELDDTEVLPQCENDNCKVNTGDVSEDVQVQLDEFSNGVVGFLVHANQSAAAMAEIAAALSRREWNADTIGRVATIVRDAGFEVADIDSPELPTS
jgi:hypothetical protein